MQSFRRWLAAVACVVVAAASFALSYVALSEVAVELGAVPARLGWLVPIIIDGGIICGSAVLWSQSKESSRRQLFPYLFVAALVVMSVVVNVNHAGPSLLAKVIAALPPLVLLGTLELVASQGREFSRQAPQHAPARRTATTTDYGQEHDVRRSAPAPDPVLPAPVPSSAATGTATVGSTPDDVLVELERQFGPSLADATGRSSRSRAEAPRKATRVRAQAADY